MSQVPSKYSSHSLKSNDRVFNIFDLVKHTATKWNDINAPPPGSVSSFLYFAFASAASNSRSSHLRTVPKPDDGRLNRNFWDKHANSSAIREQTLSAL